MAKAKDKKQLIDKRGLYPKYIYILDGKAYRHPGELCDSLGLSYQHVRQTMNTKESQNIFKKNIALVKLKKDRKTIYKNGRIIVKDLVLFCQKLNITKKEVLESIKETNSFNKKIEITRHQDYTVALGYVVNGTRYPVQD